MRLHCGNCRAQMRIFREKGWKLHIFFGCPDNNCTNPQKIIVQLNKYEELQHLTVNN